MHRRDSILIAGAAAILAAAVFVVSGGSAGAAPRPPGAIAPAEAAPEAEPAPEAAALQAAVDRGPDDGSPLRASAEAADGPPPESGTIHGRIQLTAGAATAITRYQIRIAELVNTGVIEHDSGDGAGTDPGRGPYHRTLRFDRSPNLTPYFDIDGVPFSSYGYRVSVFVTGLNGSAQIVQLTPDSPEADVHLALTPPVPFSVKVHDQFRTPMTGADVQLWPAGEPLGRPSLQGKTDAYGAAVFEEVLQGEWEVRVDGTPMERVQVSPIGHVRAGAPQVQFVAIEVPVGGNLKVEVFNARFGQPGAVLELYAVDTTENRRYSGETDRAGVFTFQHLRPGKYQLDVRVADAQPRTRSIVIPAEGSPEPVRVDIR